MRWRGSRAAPPFAVPDGGGRRGRGLGLGGGRRLGRGGAGLQAHLETQRADLEVVLVVQLALALDRRVVDEGAVGAVEIADEDLFAADQRGAEPLADQAAG